VPDSLEARLASGAPLVGTVLTLPGATAAELLAEPFDLVWVDLEHGALGPLDAQEMMLGAQATGAFVLARLPAGAHPLMTQMLDAGADGLVLADVASAAVVSRVMERTSHPPHGTRGWGPRRLSMRNRSIDRTSAKPSIWVQLESSIGIDNIDEILAVPGVNAAVVGTADLSFALGTPLDTNAPGLIDAVDRVHRACGVAGVAFGVAGALTTAAPELYARASILVHSTDARLCANAVDSAAAWMRSALDHEPDGAAA
jgi:2-keto-3-deoxy-L-rhamnonate aldolase RhmA